jgi:hypothetical protein
MNLIMSYKSRYRIISCNSFRIILFFTLFNHLSFSAIAQNYKDDMQKIRTEYKDKYHSFAIQYRYYPYDTVKRVTDSVWGQCFRNGGSFYYKIHSVSGLIEYIRNEKYYVEVTHSGKAIFIYKNSLVEQELWNMNKMDSLLMLPSVKVSYKNIVNGKGEYDIIYGNGIWNRVRLVFDKEKYTLDEVWLYSPAKGKIYGQAYDKPKIGVFYKDFNQDIPSNNLFDNTRYFHETGVGFAVTNAFKGYRVLDYFHNKHS